MASTDQSLVDRFLAYQKSQGYSFWKEDRFKRGKLQTCYVMKFDRDHEGKFVPFTQMCRLMEEWFRLNGLATKRYDVKRVLECLFCTLKNKGFSE